MRLIYAPRGHAAEYAARALNIWEGCGHGCKYCYVPGITHKSPEQHRREVKPRRIDYAALRREARKETEEILLCFTSDPYQPAEEKALHTRKVLQILGEAGALISVLTKAPWTALRDIDLFRRYDIRLGVTIVFTDDLKRQKYEPGAPSIESRIEAVRKFKAEGIQTWISLEPVVDCQQALDVIRTCGDLFDEWKIGKVNHIPQLEKQNWTRFIREAASLLKGRAYMFKDSLGDFIPPGICKSTPPPPRQKTGGQNTIFDGRE